MKEEYTKEYIGNLLARFMEGETALEEESVLSDYFQSHQDVPAEWAEYKQMFGWFDQGMPLAVSRHQHWRWPWVAAAVAMAVLIVAAFTFPRPDKKEVAQSGYSQQIVTQTSIKEEPEVEKPSVTISVPLLSEGKREVAAEAKGRLRHKHIVRKEEKMADEPKLASNLNSEVVKKLLEDDARNEALHREQIMQMVLFDAQMQSQGYLRVMLDDGTIAYAQQPINMMQ